VQHLPTKQTGKRTQQNVNCSQTFELRTTCNREVAGSNLGRTKVYSAFHPSRVGKWLYRLWLGRQRQVWLIPFAFAQDVQVKLWYPLIMRAIAERLRDVSCTGAIQIDIAFTFTFLHWSFSSNSTSGQLLRTIRLGLLEHRVVESCTPFLSASSIDRCNVYIHLTAPLHPSTFGTIPPNNKYQRSWPHKGYAQPSTFTQVTSHLQMPSG